MIYILMATYNGEKYIEDQLESLLNQTFTDWKLLIHDDGSTDATLEILKKYTDSRIFLINDGVRFKNSTENFLYLSRMVDDDADYFCFCDQDDVWEKTKLETQLKVIQNTDMRDGPVCVYSDLRVVNSSGATIHNSFWTYSGINRNPDFYSLFLENSVTGCTMLMNKVVLNYLKKMDGKKIIQHDWCIALICAAEGRLVKITTPLVNYRQHERNVVGAKKQNTLKNILSRSIFNRIKKLENLKKRIEVQLAEVGTTLSNMASINEIHRFIGPRWLWKPYFIAKGCYSSRGILGYITKIFFY